MMTIVVKGWDYDEPDKKRKRMGNERRGREGMKGGEAALPNAF